MNLYEMSRVSSDAQHGQTTNHQAGNASGTDEIRHIDNIIGG
jgi:hypothetical protein